MLRPRGKVKLVDVNSRNEEEWLTNIPLDVSDLMKVKSIRTADLTTTIGT